MFVFYIPTPLVHNLYEENKIICAKFEVWRMVTLIIILTNILTDLDIFNDSMFSTVPEKI